ncbi:TonB-dependent receptor plug domain-containing protein [candidate division KSB1 bacterium]
MDKKIFVSASIHNKKTANDYILLFIVSFIVFSLIFPDTILGQMNIEDLRKMSFEELMNVEIITAGKTSQKISDIPASVILITRKEIEKYGYTGLDEILENIPGLFNINDYCNDMANLGIRGFWGGIENSNIFYMINGVNQVLDLTSDYWILKIAVPVEAIDRIEVIRGPMSIMYGSGAFFGAINIITNEQNKNESETIFSGSIGSEKTRKLYFRSSGNKDDISYTINFSDLDSYGIDESYSRMVRQPSILPSYGISADQKTGSTLELDQKYFNFSGSFRDITLDIGFSQAEKGLMYLFPSLPGGSPERVNSTSASLGYKKTINEDLSIKGRIGYFNDRNFARYKILSNDFYGMQQTEGRAYEVEFNAVYKPSYDLGISTGLHARSVVEAYNMYDLPSYNLSYLTNANNYVEKNDRIETRSFFTEADYHPFKNTQLIGGLRFEQMPAYRITNKSAMGTGELNRVSGKYEHENIEVIPRFAFIHSVNNTNILKILYGQATNRPSFFHNTTNAVNPAFDVLEPERISTFEINYISAFHSKFTFNISCFRNSLNNLIKRTSKIDDNGDYVSYFRNFGKMLTNGAEVSISIRPIDDLSMELSGSYQKTEDNSLGMKDIEAAYSPKLLGYLKAIYQINNNSSLGLTGSYVDKMHTFYDTTPLDLLDPNSPSVGRIGDRSPDYFNIGANLRIEELFSEKLFCSLRVSNILDTEIRYPTTTNNTWADRGTLGHGRFFMFTMGYKH